MTAPIFPAIAYVTERRINLRHGSYLLYLRADYPNSLIKCAAQAVIRPGDSEVTYNRLVGLAYKELEKLLVAEHPIAPFTPALVTKRKVEFSEAR